MWNDNITFFAPMADHKLPRLIGQKPKWNDKYNNCRNRVKYVAMIVAVFTVLFF